MQFVQNKQIVTNKNILYIPLAKESWRKRDEASRIKTMFTIEIPIIQLMDYFDGEMVHCKHIIHMEWRNREKDVG